MPDGSALQDLKGRDSDDRWGERHGRTAGRWGRATLERSCGNGFKKIVSYRIKGERSSESPPAEGVLVSSLYARIVPTQKF